MRTSQRTIFALTLLALSLSVPTATHAQVFGRAGKVTSQESVPAIIKTIVETVKEETRINRGPDRDDDRKEDKEKKEETKKSPDTATQTPTPTTPTTTPSLPNTGSNPTTTPPIVVTPAPSKPATTTAAATIPVTPRGVNPLAYISSGSFVGPGAALYNRNSLAVDTVRLLALLGAVAAATGLVLIKENVRIPASWQNLGLTRNAKLFSNNLK